GDKSLEKTRPGDWERKENPMAPWKLFHAPLNNQRLAPPSVGVLVHRTIFPMTFQKPGFRPKDCRNDEETPQSVIPAVPQDGFERT
ncbi:MAG: hypothetical protein C4576_02025, partial [Desulfobacteraceae bacterium]